MQFQRPIYWLKLVEHGLIRQDLIDLGLDIAIHDMDNTNQSIIKIEH